MHYNLYSFLLPMIAGLSTLIGLVLIFIKFKNINTLIVSTLSFSFGVMITISITDLIPESYKILSTQLKSIPCLIIIGIFFCIGNIISLKINRRVKGKGSNLYNLGIISMIAIILHNIPEGMLTFISTSSNFSMGISMTLAIMFHNIPEGIIIAVPLYYATNKKRRAIIYTLIAALSEPFGAILTYILMRNLINKLTLSIIYAITAGIMFNICFYDILPELNYLKKNKRGVIYTLFGIFMTIVVHFIIN